MKETEAEAEKLDQGIWARVCMHIHRPAYAGQLYAYAYFELVYARKSMHTQKHSKEP